MSSADEKFADLVNAGVVPLPRTRAATTTKVANGTNIADLLPPFTAELPRAADTNMPHYRSNGISDKKLRALQNETADGNLDLHGLTRAEAHHALEQFLRRARQNGWRVVEIIHGRGSHSADANAGVLRQTTRYWLRHCALVLAYCEPRGNSGAVHVLLRRDGR